MSKRGLEKIADFIFAISEDRDFEKVVIGQFDKYTVFVISNDGPYFYVEYLAESELDDILYRFNLYDIDNYDGLGEFNKFDELDKFIDINKDTLITTWQRLNNKGE